jgi:uncharacterized membrane protein
VVGAGREEVVTWFEIVKFLHILFAIIAVGFNASYGIWLARAARNPDHEPYILRGVKILDDRFANPAYGLLLVTGLIMVAISPFELTAFWIALALALYALALVMAAAVYTPTLRKQIAVLEAEGPDSAAYRRLSARGTVTGILLAVDVVAIVFLMVTKPTL